MYSDPVAFQWLSGIRQLSDDIQYIDIDFPNLISRKCDVIERTPQLRELLGSYERFPESNGICLRSSRYLALGCDLGNTDRLDELLAQEIVASVSLILCTAEVSITYMDRKGADALICWGAQYDDST